MKQNFVVCKGERYNSGDKINILWYFNGSNNPRNHIGTFVDCDEENNEYRINIDGIIYSFNKICFYQIVKNKNKQESVLSYNKDIPKKNTFKDELNIDGLFIAWVWYIFIMAIGTIFYGNIVIWILASVIFFNYRKSKLKEAGYK